MPTVNWELGLIGRNRLGIVGGLKEPAHGLRPEDCLSVNELEPVACSNDRVVPRKTYVGAAFAE